MANIADVERIVRDLPGVTEGARYGNRTWFVAKQGFVWERPLTKADVKRLGDEPEPAGPLLAVKTADLDDKEAVLQAGTRGVFTISHFDGYPSVLIQLELVTTTALRELVVDAWLAVAPPKLAQEYLARPRSRRRGS